MGGKNDGPIEVVSRHDVVVQDSGEATATSGTSTATHRGPTPVASAALPSPVASPTPVSMALPVKSDSVSRRGLVTDNVVQSRTETLVEAAGDGAHALELRQAQAVALNKEGQSSAQSGDACGGPACGATARAAATSVALHADASSGNNGAAATSPGTVQARSGAAEALGLIAQNAVNTVADVAVRIAGENKSLVRIVTDSITRIVNIGQAVAVSGQATATRGELPALQTAADAGQTASEAVPWNGDPMEVGSGDAAAHGAQVRNHVELGANATVHVRGDNYNPINIVVDFLVRLVTKGSASAQSGAAEASAVADAGIASHAGAGPLSAMSGGARSTGLDVQNAVDLRGGAQVTIDGSNYAPIEITIRFITEIFNFGRAEAASGSAQASQAATTSPASLAATNAGELSPPALATSSGATAMPVTDEGQASRSGWAQAVSGSGEAIGVDSTFVAANVQFSGVSGAKDAERSTLNTATYHIETSGTARLSTGMAVAGPTPVPTPSSETAGIDEPHGSSREHEDSPARQELAAAIPTPTAMPVASSARTPSGTFARVSPWNSVWPEPGDPSLPPQQVNSLRVDVAPWPSLPDETDPVLPVQPEPERRGMAVQVAGRSIAPVADEQPAASPVTDVAGAAAERTDVLLPTRDEVAIAPIAQEPSSTESQDEPPLPPIGGQSTLLSTLAWQLATLLVLAAAVVAGWRRPLWLRTVVQRGVHRLLTLL